MDEQALQKKLQGLGNAVKGGIGPRPDQVSLARAKFLANAAGPRSSPSRASALWRTRDVAFGALLAAAAVLLWSFYHRPLEPSNPLAFDVHAQPGVVGRWIGAREQAIPVRFSDGTIVSFAPAAHGRVSELRPNGANVVIESGQVDVHVVPRPQTKWMFSVGPFDVAVKGTRFDVSWNPSTEAFRLVLWEGSVTVSGCGKPPRQVAAGEQVDEHCPVAAAGASAAAQASGMVDVPPQAPAMDASPSNVLSHAPVQEPGTAQTDEAGRSAAEPDRLIEDASPAPADPLHQFREQFSEGNHRQAWAAVADRFNDACARASIDDLMHLADTARLTGHAAEARAALLKLRERGPGSRFAAVAAFHLGLMAADSGNHADAVRWLDGARSEDRTGTIRREATGRLIESLAATDRVRALQVAREYLNAYPDGPHAKAAHALLRGGDGGPP